jgi:hypothetical protein
MRKYILIVLLLACSVVCAHAQSWDVSVERKAKLTRASTPTPIAPEPMVHEFFVPLASSDEPLSDSQPDWVTVQLNANETIDGTPGLWYVDAAAKVHKLQVFAGTDGLTFYTTIDLTGVTPGKGYFFVPYDKPLRDMAGNESVATQAIRQVEQPDGTVTSGSWFIPPLDTPTPTFTPTFTPTDTPTFTPTFTPTDTPTNTPTDTPTITPTFTPTDTPTNTPTDTPTFTPTFTPTLTPTPTWTIIEVPGNPVVDVKYLTEDGKLVEMHLYFPTPE